MRAAVALALVCTAGMANAGTVTLVLDLAVERRQTGAIYGGPDDPAFVPFNSSATLTFDSTWAEGYVIVHPAGGYIETVANFDGHNTFASGLTALLPWGPPFGVPASLEYDRAIYVHDTFTDPGADPAEDNWLLFDKRHYYHDSVARVEYRHAFALHAYPGTVYPIAPDFADFRTDDLIAYLAMLQANQIPFEFFEMAYVSDYGNQQPITSVLYRARATIADIAVVPTPGAAWLFGGALGTLGWLRRRPHELAGSRFGRIRQSRSAKPGYSGVV